MLFLNIAGYKFIPLMNLSTRRTLLLEKCTQLALKGTILLSEEGINLNLAGKQDDLTCFKNFLNEDESLAGISFHETFSASLPFKRLKIKLKKEIISFRQNAVNPLAGRAPAVTPETFKQWLDENRAITILDTRNDYEYRFGTFDQAVNLNLDHFCQLPDTLSNIDKEKPIVMFCTGGIRCEKAALHLINEGYREVYQLDGGILGYFAKVGGDHYQGECFVFDERVAVDTTLQSSSAKQCCCCQGPIWPAQQKLGSDICHDCQAN